VLTNAAVEKVREIEKEKGAAVAIEDIYPLVAARKPQGAARRRDGRGGVELRHGRRLIHDIPTCKELIERIVSEAEDIVRNQLLPRSRADAALGARHPNTAVIPLTACALSRIGLWRVTSGTRLRWRRRTPARRAHKPTQSDREAGRVRRAISQHQRGAGDRRHRDCGRTHAGAEAPPDRH